PLLPSTTVGTIEFRSIIESAHLAKKGVSYVQAECTEIDPAGRHVTCRLPSGENLFTADFDHLVIAVGAINNTHGVPGVEEHAFFLKELRDARAIRQRIIQRFEEAAFPGVSPEEQQRLLRLVVVGGGPTGVEFAAEMHDF